MGANLKEVRIRIKSVKSTQQITKAMKLVAASKLRKAQDSIQRLRPFSNKLEKILANILANTESEIASSLAEHREINRVLLIVVTSSRGLCGAFNTNIIKEAVNRIHTNYEELRKQGRITIACIGKRGYEYFTRHYSDCRIVDDYVYLFENLSFDNIASLADSTMHRFETKRYDVVDVAYAEFKNAVFQIPKVERYLPVEGLEEEREEEQKRYVADYIFEPDQHELLQELIPSILRVEMQKYMLDTHASEHGARMTAMDAATENAEDLLRDLKIMYNKARQEAITKEISEIVGGAAALAGN